MKTYKKIVSLISCAVISSSSVSAGELTGSLSLDWNSHFMSYGVDVWGSGTSASRKWTFNPSLSLDYKINDKLTLSSGFWMDVNDNPTGSDIETQETDVWFGVSYTAGIATFSATYQSWQYGINPDQSYSDTEEVLDLGVAFDTVLSPSLTIHKRLDGAGNQHLGTFAVLGAEHTFEMNEKFSVTIPVAVGFALTDFHTTETGYAFASAGVQASYALSSFSSFNFGVTYYDTDKKVVGNSEDSFLTYNAGISFDF